MGENTRRIVGRTVFGATDIMTLLVANRSATRQWSDSIAKVYWVLLKYANQLARINKCGG